MMTMRKCSGLKSLGKQVMRLLGAAMQENHGVSIRIAWTLPSRFRECRIRVKGRYFVVLESDA